MMASRPICLARTRSTRRNSWSRSRSDLRPRLRRSRRSSTKRHLRSTRPSRRSWNARKQRRKPRLVSQQPRTRRLHLRRVRKLTSQTSRWSSSQCQSQLLILLSRATSTSRKDLSMRLLRSCSSRRKRRSRSQRSLPRSLSHPCSPRRPAALVKTPRVARWEIRNSPSQ